MFRIFSYFTFIQSVIAQFRDPLLTLAPPPTVPILTIGTIAPVRTIPTITRPLPTTTTTTTTTTIFTTTPITTTTFLPQSTEPNNLEELDTNLLFLIIPSGLLLIFFAYLCFKKRKQNVNVINIDLNIENNIPERSEPIKEELIKEELIKEELKRTPSNLSEHFYEEINYEARYEMPNVRYENVIENNEYGTQVTTSV
jgi:hypothetical protein